MSEEVWTVERIPVDFEMIRECIKEVEDSLDRAALVFKINRG